MVEKCVYIFLRFLFIIKRRIYCIRNDKFQKIIIFAYTGLGNFILYTPFIKELRKIFPKSIVTIIYDNKTKCIESIKGSNLFDELIFFKRNSSIIKILKMIIKLYINNYDLSINEFHNKSTTLMLLTALSMRKYRMGHITSPDWYNKWDFIYNIPVEMKRNQHEIDRYLMFIAKLGFNKQVINKSTFFFISKEDKNFAEDFIIKNELEGKKIIGIQAGSSSPTFWKRWGEEKYAKLSNLILQIPDTEIILFGSSSEVYIINRISKMITKKHINLAGMTSIKQSAAIINKINILVCNDSGLMHVAVAVGTPVIAIYGPTDYTRTAPLGKKHIIIRKEYNCGPCFKLHGQSEVRNCKFNYKCLNDITEEEVFKVIQKKLITL